MTAQASDLVQYLGHEFDLAGVNGQGLFEPQQYELRPKGICSTCWRGFHCIYSVSSRQLVLAKLVVDAFDGDQAKEAERGTGPLLFGHHPKPFYYDGTMRDPEDGKLKRKSIPRGFAYEPSAPIAFSGGLLLAKRFIAALYVHMGFHPAWKFSEVHELIFDQGRLTQASDRSAEMKRFRDEMQDHSSKPDSGASRKEIEEWVAKCFCRDYRW